MRAFFLDYDGTLTSHRGSSSGILTLEPSADVLAVLKVWGEGCGQQCHCEYELITSALLVITLSQLLVLLTPTSSIPTIYI